MNKHIIFLILLLFLFESCNKKNISNDTKSSNVKTNDVQIYQFFEPKSSNYLYIFTTDDDIVALNGKKIRVYNGKTKETPWGPLYAPVIYLYDKDNKELDKYDVLDLISENFWSGQIDITYNNERNSFDMVFSQDAYGNYGTAYIDLNTNKFVHELLAIDREGPSEEERQHQGR
jgi:hypothetical protein